METTEAVVNGAAEPAAAETVPAVEEKPAEKTEKARVRKPSKKTTPKRKPIAKAKAPKKIAKPAKSVKKEKEMPAKKKPTGHSKGDKVGTAIREDTRSRIYKLQAKLQLQTGKHTSVSDAIDFALDKVL